MIAIPLAPMQTTTAAMANRSPILLPKIANISSPKASSTGIAPMDGQFDRAEVRDTRVIQRRSRYGSHGIPVAAAGQNAPAEPHYPVQSVGCSMNLPP